MQNFALFQTAQIPASEALYFVQIGLLKERKILYQTVQNSSPEVLFRIYNLGPKSVLTAMNAV